MKIIHTSSGYDIQVDDADFDELSKSSWHVSLNMSRSDNARPYARRNTTVVGKRKTIYLHDVIIGRMGLDKVKGLFIDHVNGDTLNNTRANLRVVTNRQNQANRHTVSKSSKLNQSKYKGVFWNKRANKWEAAIGVSAGNGKKKKLYIGTFVDEVKAAQAYNEKAVEIYGEFAALNVI